MSVLSQNPQNPHIYINIYGRQNPQGQSAALFPCPLRLYMGAQGQTGKTGQMRSPRAYTRAIPNTIELR